MAKQNYDDSEGRWVTIAGRRVFIKNNQPLDKAMVESGKFESEIMENRRKKSLWGKERPYREYKSKCKVSDITSNFSYSVSGDDNGKYDYDKGYSLKKHKKEIETAKWLVKRYGGHVHCETEDTKRKNFDYTWNGKAWELKSLKNANLNTICGRTSEGIRQTCVLGNHGGVILDVRENKNDIADIMGAISRGVDLQEFSNAVVILIRSDGEPMVLEYRKNAK